MNPLIQSFTKGLQPCTGCGKTEYSDFFEQRDRGEKVKFIIQLAVEADRSSAIDQRAIEASCNGEIRSINPIPQPVTPTTGSRVTGSQIPAHMTISKTPTTTETKQA